MRLGLRQRPKSKFRKFKNKIFVYIFIELPQKVGCVRYNKILL